MSQTSVSLFSYGRFWMEMDKIKTLICVVPKCYLPAPKKRYGLAITLDIVMIFYFNQITAIPIFVSLIKNEWLKTRPAVPQGLGPQQFGGPKK